jgi:very-short-patch-repair endonuclease
MKKLHTIKSLKLRRQDLRKASTPEEHIIWAHVRSKKMGCKFYRQHSIGPYVVDFYCPKAKLIVELDGNHHADPEIKKYDSERTVFLESLGFKVVRFWNNEVTNDMRSVIDSIRRLLP